MPGSMSTGTALTLNKVPRTWSAKKSGDGGTMRTVRVPPRCPGGAQSVGDGVGIGVQFGKGDGAVIGRSVRGGVHSPKWSVDRDLRGVLGRHPHEVQSDVERGRHVTRFRW